MTDNDKFCPPPREVQDFLFKQASVGQICDEFQSIPIGSNLITADGKRGLLYIGHENKLIVVKPGNNSSPEWKFELDLSDRVCRVGLSCDNSFLVVIFNRPAALIYDACSVHKHKLDSLHEIRLSTTVGDVFVADLKWNPAIPEMLCSITSDHTIGVYQVNKDKTKGIQIVGMERIQGLEALCLSWSPKGKQLVVGCTNGDIVQLKPELKVARHLRGPNPSEGIIISILWVSNYQFCACYFHPTEQRVSVIIIDAPKGATVAKFTNYEDITFGSGSIDGLSYYFEHISEWGIIIAASTHSSEVAVLGTSDNGATWNLWQLMDDSTAQLPLNRKKKTENYPLGISVDKSSTHKLPWGAENTLPNPVPILRILVTSGQLCCYHMVNLKENAPCICSPPIEVVAAPQLPRPSLGPSEVSFNLHAATSTPSRPKPAASNTQIEMPKPANMFANMPSSNFSFLDANAPQGDLKNLSFSAPAPAEVKTGTLFGQGDGRTGFFAQETNVNKPAFGSQALQVDQQIKQPPPIVQQPSAQPEVKSGFALKPDVRTEVKTSAPALQSQIETKTTKEIPKDPSQYNQDQNKLGAKEAPVYDDRLCLQAYYEEQAKFEKELKSRLDLPSWNCGTNEEREILVKKSSEIEEFLKDLRETTNSLANDIAYLKALLLQSFAWIEETKSKNSANSTGSSRNRADGNKLADIQRLYYYTQSQLIQATKVLDLEWTEHKNREMSKMRIPSLEVIYQTLVRYRQIIMKEKKNLGELSKKWRVIGRGNSSVSNLDRSLANLSLSGTKVNDTAIALRCKLIATNTRSFSREKQMKLRDLLSESAPRIVKAARPTAVQDRLEATLSSLASLKATEANAKVKPVKVTTEQQKPAATPAQVEPAKAKPQTALSSLDNFVSGVAANVSSMPSLSKSPSSTTFSSFGMKPMPTTTVQPQLKAKENTPLSFGQSTAAGQPLQATPSMGKPFGKVDGISFGSPAQKIPEPQASKENVSKPVVTDTSSANKFSIFPAATFDNPSMLENLPTATATASTTSAAVPKLTFNFTSPGPPPPTPQGFAATAKLDANSVFKFSSKPAAPAGAPQTPPAQGLLDLSSLSFGSRPGLTVTSTSEAKTATSATTLPTLSFGKPSTPQQQASVLGQSTGLNLQSQIGKSFGTAATPVSGTDKSAAVTLSTAATTIATSTPASVASTKAAAAATATPAATTSASVFGTSTLFGSLSSSTAPFSFSAPSTQATATSTAATSTPTIAFGGTQSMAPSSTPSFGGIFGATASFSFGTPATTTAATTPAFSKSTAPPNATVFGSSTPASTAAAAVSSTTPTAFGKSDASAAPTTSASPFGGVTSTASTTTTTTASTVFGVSSTTPSMFVGQTAVSSPSDTNIIGAKAPTSTAAPTGSIFGGGSTTTTSSGSIFGSTGVSVFGAANTATQPSNVFGASNTAQNTGTPVFGASNVTQNSGTSVFGGSSTTQSGGTSVFGASNTAQSPSTIFGGANATIASPVFGATPTTTATSVFGAAATPATGSMFGGGAAGSSMFGASAAPAAGSVFGASSTTATSLPCGSMFGAGTISPPAATSNVFGAVAASPSAPGTGSIFGAPATMGAGTSMFGGAAAPGGGMGSTSVFGQPAAFGAKPVFGSPTGGFGAANTGFGGGGFGSPPAFGAAPATGFGSPSMLGAGSPLGGTSPSKVFGSSTFEALGSQSGGLSFGSLAQSSPEQQKPKEFQGSSSFSSWR